MMFYTFDEFGRYAGTSEVETDRSTDIAPAELTADYFWNFGTWVFAPNLKTEVSVVQAEVSTPLPAFVTPRQARLVLVSNPATDEAYPNLLAQVEAAFASLPEPLKTQAEITWEYSTEIQRNNPLIAQMQAVIGFTDEQIDQLFIQAATL